MTDLRRALAFPKLFRFSAQIPFVDRSCTMHRRNRISRRLECKCALKRLGVAATEFAIVAPILFIVVFVMFEFGRIVMIQQCLTNASRTGCRRAILATTTTKTQVEDTVRQHLSNAMSDTSKVTIDVNPKSLSDIDSGTQVSVNVSVPYSEVSWVPSELLSATISASSIQQRE